MMTRYAPLLVALMACSPTPESAGSGSEPIEPYDVLSYVDPFVATGGIGAQVTAVTPAAAAPFGMTLVGPDTRHSTRGQPVFYHMVGYHYDDDMIDGFSHTHSHGMGVGEYGGVMIMPRANWSDDYTTDAGRSAPFTHDDESATAGQYSVRLQDDQTQVDIVATRHGAHHRYQFAEGQQPVVILDLGHKISTVNIADGNVQMDLAAGKMHAFQLLRGGYSERFDGLQTHIEVVVDPLPEAVGAWNDPENPQAGLDNATGNVSGGWFQFPAGTTQVDVRVSLSYVDPEGALANLEAELPDTDFDARVAEVRSAWVDEIGRVRLGGGSETDMRIFHTAQYHTMLMPRRFDDVDGRYRGIDGQVHSIDHPYYSDFSMWDTFRTSHPWYVMVQPEHQRDMVQSLVQMNRDGGDVPRWPLGHGYTGGMVGTPADQVFAGTYLKGIRNWDYEEAFEACLEHAEGPTPQSGRAGIEAYREQGYVTLEAAGQPASRTLEFVWNDHALALWADAMGKTEDAAMLHEQSRGWRNIWDAETQFMRGRHDDGTFDPMTDPPTAWNSDYTEGNAWHYVWGVPWDVQGLIDLQHDGDRDAFLGRVSTFWDDVRSEEDDLFPDDYYWHGNEPVMHYAALGSLAGDQALSAEAARWVLRNRYNDTPLGLDGNDDAGTLSAWFLWNSIGLFPIAGTPNYAVTSPLFDRVEIDRPDGTWVLRAGGAGQGLAYVSGITTGMGQVQSPVLTHEQLLSGEVILHMTGVRDQAMR